ncbi:hypothetical protein T484DRAFT_3122003 [Baffinella frigidus]|nr:hypothetical protein T484DRAFT_3122003 [Cryptophyta sp. CCMP2293]
MDTSQEGMADFLSGMVVETLQELTDAGCIAMDNDETQSVASTTLGKIASHYYLDYTSVRLYALSHLGI